MRYNSFHRRMLALYNDKADMYFHCHHGILEVDTIDVHERSRGTGTAIMESILRYAHESGWVVALTPCGSLGGEEDRLIEFYTRFGFAYNNGRFPAAEGTMVLDCR